MQITLERTRIIITEYSEVEQRKLANMVSTMDKTFYCIDNDYNKIYIAPGLIDEIRKKFPKAEFHDNSATNWPYATIKPVEHSATPRNQLQIDFIDFLLENSNKGYTLAGILSPGTGKEQPVTVRIPTPDGNKMLKSIQVGDFVFDRNGNPTKVTQKFNQGWKDVYKVFFSDGRYSLCGLEHQWGIVTDDGIRTLTTQDMLNDFKVYDEEQKVYRHKYSILVLKNPTLYSQKDLPVHPYVMGVLLAGANFNSELLSIIAPNPFTTKQIESLCLWDSATLNDCLTRYFKNQDSRYVKTKEVLREVPELIDLPESELFIPENYKYSLVKDRIDLLKGIMDVSGEIDSEADEYHFSFSCFSKRLLKDIQEVIHGLGYFAYIEQSKNKHQHGYYGTIHIDLPKKDRFILFNDPNKLYLTHLATKNIAKEDNREPLKIVNIEKVSRAECQCIAVDAEDKLYLTQDYIVTHNTFMACYTSIKVGQKTLIVAPTSSIKQQWADTLTGMFNVSKDRVMLVNKPTDFFNANADFVVISHASLATLYGKYNLEELMKKNKFGIKVIDEVQMWFHNILKIDASSNICNNWYITGTFGRSGEEENDLYQKMFGRLKIFREKDKPKSLFNRNPGNIYGMKPHMHTTLVWTKSGVLNGLTPEEKEKLLVSWKYSEHSDKWSRIGLNIPRYTNYVIPPDGKETKFRKTLIDVIKLAYKKVLYGKTLVLVPTIAAVEIIADVCREEFPGLKIGTVHSRNSKDQNADAKKNADMIISTAASAGTGFDCPGLSRLINGQQLKSWILTDQISGRLRRRPDGLDTYMWDIVDASIPQLRAWAKVRTDVLKRKSKSFTIIDM